MGGGGYVGNLKVLSEIKEALPPPLEKVNFRHWSKVSKYAVAIAFHE